MFAFLNVFFNFFLFLDIETEISRTQPRTGQFETDVETAWVAAVATRGDLKQTNITLGDSRGTRIEIGRGIEKIRLESSPWKRFNMGANAARDTHGTSIATEPEQQQQQQRARWQAARRGWPSQVRRIENGRERRALCAKVAGRRAREWEGYRETGGLGERQARPTHALRRQPTSRRICFFVCFLFFFHFALYFCFIV